MNSNLTVNLRPVASAAALAVALFASPAMSVPMAQGPLLNATTPTSAHVWARWSGATTVYVKFRSGEDPSFVSTTSVGATADNDFTSSFSLDRLKPNTTYEYRFVTTNASGVSEESAGAFFDTLKSKPTSISFSVLSDFSLKLKTSAAVVSSSQPRPDFVAVIGDWDHRDPASPPGVGGAYPPGSDSVVLENMRQMHRDTRDSTTPIGADIYSSFMSSARRGNHQIPLYYGWDDHDFCMNNAGSDCPFSAVAFQSYQEYFRPSDDNGLNSVPTCGARGDWQSFKYGDLASFFMLDARSNRIDGTTMLGACQLQWLKDGLKNADTTWKFIFSPVTFNPGTKPWDSWAGFPAERQQLLDFIAREHLKRVIVMSGDIHSGGAVDDGSHSGLPEISVPHANMPRTWVNTYCRVEDTPSRYLRSEPGTWSIGGLQDPNTQIHPQSCLGKEYKGIQQGPLPPAPYPLDGTDSPGFLHVDVSSQGIQMLVKDADGNLKTGFRADGSSAPMSLTLQK